MRWRDTNPDQSDGTERDQNVGAAPPSIRAAYTDDNLLSIITDATGIERLDRESHSTVTGGGEPSRRGGNSGPPLKTLRRRTHVRSTQMSLPKRGIAVRSEKGTDHAHTFGNGGRWRVAPKKCALTSAVITVRDLIKTLFYPGLAAL